MKLISMFVIVLIFSGCTTLKPVELSPEQLHERISTGEVIQAGDDVKLITADGEQHEFKVIAVTNDRIMGEDIEIPIVDIIAVETREFSGGKTAVLAGSAYLLYALLAIVALAATAGL